MSFREKIAHLKSAKEVGSFLIVENASLVTTYSDVCTACIMYMTVPVTGAMVERSFSKLKLIKIFLRSSMFQKRHSGLALLSIENKPAKTLDFRKVIQQFASTKAGRKNFKFPTTHKEIAVANLISLNLLCFTGLRFFVVMSVYRTLILFGLNNLSALHSTFPF